MSENKYPGDINKWPDNWIELTCPNGHTLTTYDSIVNDRVYAFCGVCKIPCVFTHAPIKDIPLRIMLPPDDNVLANFPPFDFPPMTDNNDESA